MTEAEDVQPSSGMLFRNHGMMCPWCGHEQTDVVYEYFPGDCDCLYDGATTKADCPSCGKDYDVMLNLDITYTTAKPEAAESGS